MGSKTGRPNKANRQAAVEVVTAPVKAKRPKKDKVVEATAVAKPKKVKAEFDLAAFLTKKANKAGVEKMHEASVACRAARRKGDTKAAEAASSIWKETRRVIGLPFSHFKQAYDEMGFIKHRGEA